MHLYLLISKGMCLDMANKICIHYVHEAADELTSSHKKNLQFLIKSPNSPQKYKTVELNQMQQSSPGANLLWGFPTENTKRAESSDGRTISPSCSTHHWGAFQSPREVPGSSRVIQNSHHQCQPAGWQGGGRASSHPSQSPCASPLTAAGTGSTVLVGHCCVPLLSSPWPSSLLVSCCGGDLTSAAAIPLLFLT